MSLLWRAVQASNAQYDPPEFLNRVGVKMLPTTHSDSGWDVFSLEYAVETPIDTVFDDSSMRQYERMFNFLWKIKRVEHSLSTVWRRSMNLANKMAMVPGLDRLLHASHMLRGQMNRFVDNLHTHLKFEAIEASWHEFIAQIGGARDLDLLIRAHAAYLQNLEKKLFLSKSSTVILTQIHQLSEVVLRFAYFQSKLLTDAEEIADQINEQYNGDFDPKQDIADLDQELLEQSRAIVRNARGRLADIHSIFQQRMQVLLATLTERGIDDFCFILDFNRFYADSSEKERGTQERRPLRTA